MLKTNQTNETNKEGLLLVNCFRTSTLFGYFLKGEGEKRQSDRPDSVKLCAVAAAVITPVYVLYLYRFRFRDCHFLDEAEAIFLLVVQHLHYASMLFRYIVLNIKIALKTQTQNGLSHIA